MKLGQAPGKDRVAVRSQARPLPNPEPILGFVEREEDGHRVRTDAPKDYQVQLMHDFAGTETVVRPYAYLLPASFFDAVATLKRHGIQVQELREDLDLDVEAYRVDEVGKPASSGWDRQDLVELRVSLRRETRRVPAGTLIIRTAQPLGNLALYLLEPRSEDGLAAWKFFDGTVKAGADYPVLRLQDPVPMTMTAAEPLAEDLQHDLPVTFDLAGGRRGEGMLSGSPVSATWLDGESWLQVREGKLHKVQAATGRSRPFVDVEALTRALQRLPTLGGATARRIAEGLSFDMDPGHKGFLFSQNEDLYYATFDGTAAVRLTDHPGKEQHPRFSPDGRSVAFIRDFDLHVVEIANPHERALTTGGSEIVRHGLADWIYFEEIFNRHWPAYWWSPDSRRIALLEFDDSPVGTLAMLDDTSSPRKVERNKYPRSGEPNPRIRFGIVNPEGGSVRWANLSDYSPDNLLISQVGWWPDSSSAYCAIQDRTQTWLDLARIAADDPNPKPHRLFRDSTKAWIADPDPLVFFKDGSFLWTSERDGWKHLYHYGSDGASRAA